MSNILLEFILSVLRLSLPLMFAALGGLLSERSGIAQLGLEGMMLAGALASSLVALATGSTLAGLAAGIAVGVALAILEGIFVLLLRAEQIIVGTALNLFVFGLAPFITKVFYDTTGSTPPLPPELMWQYQFYILFAVIFVLYLFVYHRTAAGLAIRFAGENPKVLVSLGLSDRTVRWWALVVCGALSGISGATLTLMISSAFSPMMSAGRGFMALAAVIFGAWRPLPTIAACLFFAVVDAAQIRLQGSSLLPVQFVQILPYVVTIIALAGLYQRNSSSRSGGAPKGIGLHGQTPKNAE